MAMLLSALTTILTLRKFVSNAMARPSGLNDEKICHTSPFELNNPGTDKILV